MLVGGGQTMAISWGDQAWSAIRRLDERLPKDISLKDRKAALKAAYPFGERAHWPYKAWCKAQREYLARFSSQPSSSSSGIS